MNAFIHRRSLEFCSVIARSGLCAIWLAGAVPALAQNLVGNSEFDFDVLPWQAQPPEGSLAWTSVDHTGCGAASGSAFATNAAAGGTHTLHNSFCLEEVVAGTVYSFGADLRFPAGQGRTGSAFMTVGWFAGMDCTGTGLGAETASPLLETSTPGAWMMTRHPGATAPPGAQSASVQVRIYKEEAGGSLDARFDGVYVVASPGFLFADGFEIESTCRWSSEAL